MMEELHAMHNVPHSTANDIAALALGSTFALTKKIHMAPSFSSVSISDLVKLYALESEYLGYVTF